MLYTLNTDYNVGIVTSKDEMMKIMSSKHYYANAITVSMSSSTVLTLTDLEIKNSSVC